MEEKVYTLPLKPNTENPLRYTPQRYVNEAEWWNLHTRYTQRWVGRTVMIKVETEVKAFGQIIRFDERWLRGVVTNVDEVLPHERDAILEIVVAEGNHEFDGVYSELASVTVPRD